ncbi:MAG: hypothetical protein JXR83_17285 [Deltaproteobacteria bacterium]|nr:hypothetical protein [Deltaproteobacteria bacterium]
MWRFPTKLFSCLLAVACGLGASCPALEYDASDAVLEITPEGATQTVLAHEPGRSEVRITPPAGGRFTASFVYLEPRAEVGITLQDSTDDAQRDLVFPLAAEDGALVIQFSDKKFGADVAAAQGTLTVERLDSDGESISFRGIFQGTLLTSAGERAAVDGFIDAQYAASGSE